MITESEQTETTTNRYEMWDPAQFRQGDIVEAETTLTLVPVKDGKYKLIAVLRSITLLDSTHSQVSKTLIRTTKSHIRNRKRWWPKSSAGVLTAQSKKQQHSVT